MSGKGPKKPRKSGATGKGTARSTSGSNPVGQSSRSGGAQPGEFQRAQQKIEDEIRIRAYQLFEERGRQDGFEHDDWVRAEAEIRVKYQRAKSA